MKYEKWKLFLKYLELHFCASLYFGISGKCVNFYLFFCKFHIAGEEYLNIWNNHALGDKFL